VVIRLKVTENFLPNQDIVKQLAKCQFTTIYHDFVNEEDSHFKCEEEALHTDFCVFHDKNYFLDKTCLGEHNKQRAIQRLKDKINYIICHNEALFCINYHLPSIEIREKFTNAVYFLGCKFLGVADFFNTNFQERADFTFSTFQGTADFRRTTFYGRADFNSTSFKEKASFNRSNFYNEAYLTSANFHNGADFNNVRFHGEVLFNSISFKSADFMKASFPWKSILPLH
jgi:uncharacterized protein YjbI with pentapeptide repeats